MTENLGQADCDPEKHRSCTSLLQLPASPIGFTEDLQKRSRRRQLTFGNDYGNRCTPSLLAQLMSLISVTKSEKTPETRKCWNPKMCKSEKPPQVACTGTNPVLT